jgi:hypothetical protein
MIARWLWTGNPFLILHGDEQTALLGAAELNLYTEFLISGYEIRWLTNGALNVEYSRTPVVVPKASVLSEVFTYVILAVVETYHLLTVNR